MCCIGRNNLPNWKVPPHDPLNHVPHSFIDQIWDRQIYQISSKYHSQSHIYAKTHTDSDRPHQRLLSDELKKPESERRSLYTELHNSYVAVRLELPREASQDGDDKINTCNKTMPRGGWSPGSSIWPHFLPPWRSGGFSQYKYLHLFSLTILTKKIASNYWLHLVPRVQHQLSESHLSNYT